MASHDYVRFLTERLVQYIDTPRAERKRRRKERQRDPWDRRWFGDIPFSLHMSWQNNRTRLKRRKRRYRGIR